MGAWDYLQWKHIIPISNNNNNNNGNTTNGIAKIIVYAGEPEEYYSFITPEAYNAIKEWMDFRASYGEKITGESWVMRDLFPTSNVSHAKITGRLGLATNPQKTENRSNSKAAKSRCLGAKSQTAINKWKETLRMENCAWLSQSIQK